MKYNDKVKEVQDRIDLKKGELISVITTIYNSKVNHIPKNDADIIDLFELLIKNGIFIIEDNNQIEVWSKAFVRYLKDMDIAKEIKDVVLKMVFPIEKHLNDGFAKVANTGRNAINMDYILADIRITPSESKALYEQYKLEGYPVDLPQIMNTILRKEVNRRKESSGIKL